jgi:hypothetical protein
MSFLYWLYGLFGIDRRSRPRSQDSADFRQELQIRSQNVLHHSSKTRRNIQEMSEDDKALDQLSKVINKRAINVRKRNR